MPTFPTGQTSFTTAHSCMSNTNHKMVANEGCSHRTATSTIKQCAIVTGYGNLKENIATYQVDTTHFQITGSSSLFFPTPT